ncbi:UNVERIFIED_CONTAM: hypothetical protein GTU68_001288 [Idotea baltica]|nr:hypothetical protein [Idotea baltica]
MGCQVVDNLLAEWHRHFVIREKMLKVNCSSLTPEPVLRASGHVDKFTDFIVKDEVTGECFRLDHLIKHRLEETLTEGKAPPEEEAEMRGKLALLDGMTLVSNLAGTVESEDMKIILNCLSSIFVSYFDNYCTVT